MLKKENIIGLEGIYLHCHVGTDLKCRLQVIFMDMLQDY